MMIGTFITSEGESLKNLKQRMKLRGAKVTTGGRCYSRALCAIGGKDVGAWLVWFQDTRPG
jgi:hypothetical protein